MLDNVIDVSRWNGNNLNFTKAKRAGIDVAFIKASQGLASTDAMYVVNKAKAKTAGMLVGAYHFGTGDDGTAQANHFLQIAGMDVLPILDFEPNPSGFTMSLAQARTFVWAIHDRTGKYPLLYSGNLIEELLGNGEDKLLASCPFWLSQYGPKAVVPKNWPTWTFWQYTDSGMVDGIGKCDRSRFNGTADNLGKFWS